MTVEELKSMLDNQASELQGAKSQAEAAEQKAAELQADLEKKNEEITNLDASVKEQAEELKGLKAAIAEKKTQNFKTAFKSAMMERKDDIDNFVKTAHNGDRFSMEVKFASTDITDRQVAGTVLEPGVSSAPNSPLAFLGSIAAEPVNGLSLAWLEGAYTSQADYVDELAAAKDDSATVAEKHRAFGKIAAHLLVSSETQDFLSEVYNWATNEAQAKIERKAETEVFKGAGADTTAPRKVYGIKGQAQAFKALGKYASANLADVIKDAILQAQKAGFVANAAYLPFDLLPTLQGLKDANGNYLYNQMTGYIGQVKVIPSVDLGATEAVVADTNAIKIKKRPVYELEIVRNAAKDGFDVYVRRAYQVVIKSGDKGGVIYVANTTTAITSITAE
jgi:Phage capsid family.